MVFGGLGSERGAEEEKGVAVPDPGPDWRSKMTFGLKLSSLFVIEAAFFRARPLLLKTSAELSSFFLRETPFFQVRSLLLKTSA